MIKSSHLSTKTTISSVLGSDYTEPANEEEKQLRNGGVLHDVDKMYEKSHDIDDKLIGSEYSSDEELEKLNNQINFSSFCGKITRKKDLPTPLFAVFADARQKVEDPIGRYFTESNVYKVWSLLTLPITLPIDLTYTTMKRIFGIFYPSSSNQSSNSTMNFFWSFFSENDDNYCYHVNDCECTESRISSHNYYHHHHHHSYVQTYQRQISAPTNSWTSSSNESNDDDFLSVDNHHISVKQFNQSTITKEYCRHLQQMAKLSNQKQFKEKLIPIFNDDYHLIYNKTNKIPTTSLGRTLLFT